MQNTTQTKHVYILQEKKEYIKPSSTISITELYPHTYTEHCKKCGQCIYCGAQFDHEIHDSNREGFVV